MAVPDRGPVDRFHRRAARGGDAIKSPVAALIKGLSPSDESTLALNYSRRMPRRSSAGHVFAEIGEATHVSAPTTLSNAGLSCRLSLTGMACNRSLQPGTAHPPVVTAGWTQRI